MMPAITGRRLPCRTRRAAPWPGTLSELFSPPEAAA
jgi:hypothetical protein